MNIFHIFATAVDYWVVGIEIVSFGLAIKMILSILTFLMDLGCV